jgi:UDP-N-acetylmuramate--alanine ligase
VFAGGSRAGELRLRVAGRHNVLDALAAVAVGLELSVPFGTAAGALADFTGADRRLQLKGERNGVQVFDDYGHHPTEVRATIEAMVPRARSAGGRLIVLFQPHRFTRTNLLRDSFGGAFEAADAVVITDIYPAGEDPIPGVTGRTVLEAVTRHGRPQAEFAQGLEEGCFRVVAMAGKGDIVLTLGAGDVGKCGDRILTLLGMRA